MLFVYVACENNVAGTCIQDSNHKILATDRTEVEVVTTEEVVHKYNGLMVALNMAVKKLERLQEQRKFGYNDTIRLMIPSRIVYGWFKNKSADRYTTEFESLYTRFLNLMPTIECVCTAEAPKINKAVAVCTEIKEEQYSSVLDEFVDL